MVPSLSIQNIPSEGRGKPRMCRRSRPTSSYRWSYKRFAFVGCEDCEETLSVVKVMVFVAWERNWGCLFLCWWKFFETWQSWRPIPSHRQEQRKGPAQPATNNVDLTDFSSNSHRELFSHLLLAIFFLLLFLHLLQQQWLPYERGFSAAVKNHGNRTHFLLSWKHLMRKTWRKKLKTWSSWCTLSCHQTIKAELNARNEYNTGRLFEWTRNLTKSNVQNEIIIQNQGTTFHFRNEIWWKVKEALFWSLLSLWQ